MGAFIEFMGRLAMVFVPAFLLCWLSAHCAMEDQVKADWESLTAEEQAERTKHQSSTASEFGTSRRHSIAIRTALRFSISATVVILLLYAILTNR